MADMEQRFAQTTSQISEQNKRVESQNAQLKAEMDAMGTRTLYMVAQLQDAFPNSTAEQTRINKGFQQSFADSQAMMQAIMQKLNVTMPDPGSAAAATAGELSVDASVYPDNGAADDDDSTRVPIGYQMARPDRAASTTPYGR